MEAHYRFEPPNTIVRVEADGSTRELPVPKDAGSHEFAWGYAGSSPNAASWAVLEDATGSCDLDLAIGFTDDNLEWWDEIGEKEFVLTAAEVQAWRVAREAVIREQAQSSRDVASNSADVRVEEYRKQAAAGPRRPWWREYRDEHGDPDLS